MIVHDSVESPGADWGASRLVVENAGDRRQSVIRVLGEIDISTVDTFTDALSAALHDSSLQLSVDLSGITFFGVAGLRALLRLREEAESMATDLILIAPPHCVRNLMGITGTAAQFRLLDAQPQRPADVPTYRAVHI